MISANYWQQLAGPALLRRYPRPAVNMPMFVRNAAGNSFVGGGLTSDGMPVATAEASYDYKKR